MPCSREAQTKRQNTIRKLIFTNNRTIHYNSGSFVSAVKHEVTKVNNQTEEEKTYQYIAAFTNGPEIQGKEDENGKEVYFILIIFKDFIFKWTKK